MSSLAADLRSEHRRFTVPEFLRMVETGILGDEDHVELIDGEVLTVAPQGPKHRCLKDELHGRLLAAYKGESVHVLNQGPLYLGDYNLPEPDIAVIRGTGRDYLSRHPSGTDTVLVVELAISSQRRDRNKAAAYARGGVSVYWLLDLAARALAVYTNPDSERGEYSQRLSLGPDDSVSLPALPLSWPVPSLLA